MLHTHTHSHTHTSSALPSGCLKGTICRETFLLQSNNCWQRALNSAYIWWYVPSHYNRSWSNGMSETCECTFNMKGKNKRFCRVCNISGGCKTLVSLPQNQRAKSAFYCQNFTPMFDCHTGRKTITQNHRNMIFTPRMQCNTLLEPIILHCIL